VPQPPTWFFTLADSVKLTTTQIKNKMEERGVLTNTSGPRHFRLLTDVRIDDAGVDRTVAAFREIL
jgi:acetylornithine/succinyldiaminopimelate/putrescine aminotransferase